MAVKTRLSLFYLLQFAVWGCYLTSLGQFLGGAGLGKDISWFYAAVGIVSLVMPALIGYVSDRYVSPGRLLSICHISAALFMGGLWLYSSAVDKLSFWPAFSLYLCFLSLYLPTIALSNTMSFRVLARRGEDALRSFPKIRIWGTVGFVAAMWFVNSFYYHDGVWGFTLSDLNEYGRYRFQYTGGQLLAAAVIGVLTSLYALSLPKTDVSGKNIADSPEKMVDILGWRRFNLLRDPRLRIFLIFAILAGVCLQISNGFVTPFITHFAALSEYAANGVAANATMLFSISQISEALCILLVGVSLRRYGIKAVLAMAMTAWAIRFAGLALGNPGSGLWLLIVSMIAYGVAFNYFNIAGAMYVDRITDTGIKGFGQGVLMLMSNGVGATLGMFIAGDVVNYFCHWEIMTTANGQGRFFMGDWSTVWWIFAGYSLVVSLLILIAFRSQKTLRPDKTPFHKKC